MLTVIPRTHILRSLQVLDPVTNLPRPIAGWSFEAATSAGFGVTPAEPTVTNLDDTTWLLRVDTVGLNGCTCVTRVYGTDPLATDVIALDIQFNVKL